MQTFEVNNYYFYEFTRTHHGSKLIRLSDFPLIYTRKPGPIIIDCFVKLGAKYA